MNLWWYPPLRWTGLRIYRSAAGGWFVMLKWGKICRGYHLMRAY